MSRRRVILWRIPRTAGTSIVWALDQFGVTHARIPSHRLDGSDSDGVTADNADYLTCGHTTPAEVVARGWMSEAEVRHSVNLLCLRNVFDRLVSLFALLRTTGWKHPMLGHWAGSDDFAAYVAWAINPVRATDYHLRNYQCQPATDWMFINGKPLDFHTLGRFENLGGYWDSLCKLFGVSGPLPQLNGRERGPCSQYYTPKLRGLVSAFYRRENEVCGYGW